MKNFDVIVLCGGGSSAERAVSLRSGDNVFNVLSKHFNTTKVILEEDALPESISNLPNTILMPVTHGAFGEDGKLQKIMEDRGLTFVGSDSKSSSICMDKPAAKNLVAAVGVPTIKSICFTHKNIPAATEVVKTLGESLVLKPSDSGSSLGVHIISSKHELESFLSAITSGNWMIEKRMTGHDITVAVLGGKALGILEIIPQDEFLSYDSKYTPGMVQEKCPPDLQEDTQNEIKKFAELAFAACGCRDWARIDFILDDLNNPHFLEINTLPGMTATSFYPAIAQANGMSQDDLLKTLINFAANRN